MSIYQSTPQSFFQLIKLSFAGYAQVFKNCWYLILISSVLSILAMSVIKMNHYVGTAILILFFLALAFIYAIILHQSNSALAGKNIDLRESIAAAKRRYLRLLGGYVVMLVIFLILAAVDFGIFSISNVLKMQGLVVVIDAIAVLFSIFVLFLVFFTLPIIILGNHGVFKSYEDSIKLVWGNWWRTFGVLFIMYLILAAIAFFAGQLLEFKNPAILLGWNFIFHFFAYPLVISTTLILLNDLHLRKPAIY